MCQYSASFEFLSVHSPAYLPYLSPNFGSLSGQAMKRNHPFKKAKTSNKKKSVCLWQNVLRWEEYPSTSFRMYGDWRWYINNVGARILRYLCVWFLFHFSFFFFKDLCELFYSFLLFSVIILFSNLICFFSLIIKRLNARFYWSDFSINGLRGIYVFALCFIS